MFTQRIEVPFTAEGKLHQQILPLTKTG